MYKILKTNNENGIFYQRENYIIKTKAFHMPFLYIPLYIYITLYIANYLKFIHVYLIFTEESFR